MDVTAEILTEDLINRGYSVTEQPQDNIVELRHRGAILNVWCATNSTVKAKYIRGVAYQHYALNSHMIDDCRQTMESGAGWNW